MLISTTENISKDYELLRIVTGNTVYTTSVLSDTINSIKSIGQREIYSCTNTLQEARKIALSRLQKDAELINADAIIALKFESLQIMIGTFELLAYGTAVKFKQ